MFTDSYCFNVLCIHFVIARRLGASFLYKCPHRAVVPCYSTAFLLKIRMADGRHLWVIITITK